MKVALDDYAPELIKAAPSLRTASKGCFTRPRG